ncbi:MerR family transcriptional regulator [bacterium]|nr:MerR family transcriptional regulator [bacterium]
MDKQKFYYIGELSKIVEVPPHILRYWEKEFAHIKPLRDKRGNRIYTEKDILRIKRVKSLVYGNGFSIKGAKKKLRKPSSKRLLESNRTFLKIILKELQELKKCLK